MNILIIGGSGVIGSKLVQHFTKKGEIVKFTYLQHNMPYGNGYFLDITKRQDTIELIKSLKPDVVIHSTALTNVDLCETNHALADSIHVNGTRNVVDACKVVSSKLIYISTSYVFDGKKEKYHEEDLTSPVTYYGTTKVIGEEIVKESGLPFLILRTDQPYCWIEKWQHTNSVLRVIQSIRAGKIHREIRDWYNNPTYVPDFTSVTSKLLTSNALGIFHLVGSDFISRYEWSLQMAEIFGLDKDLIEPIDSSMLNLPAKRVKVNLSNDKLFKKIGIRMAGTREGMLDMIKIKPDGI